MITIQYDLLTGLAKLPTAATLRAGRDVEVQIICTPAPGDDALWELSVNSVAAVPAVLAYTESFHQENATTWAATLDCNDTRLVAFLAGQTGAQSAGVSLEITALIDGKMLGLPDLPATVQKTTRTGPATTLGGPSYYTVGQVDAKFAALPPGLQINASSGAITGPISSEQFRTANALLTTLRPVPLKLIPQLNAEAHCAGEIDRRLAGKTASAAKPLYTTQNHTSGLYVRNTGSWAADLDLTCISPWNSRGGALGGGTLIASDVVEFAWHFGGDSSSTIGVFQVGDTFRFVDLYGSVVNLHVTHAPVRVGTTDIGVVKVETAPPSITPAKLLPADYASRLTLEGLPLAYTDQEEKLLVAQIASVGAGVLTLQAPTDTQRLAFYEEVVPGDSGNGLYLVLESGLVLLSAFTSPTTGPFVSSYLTGLATAMATLGAVGALTFAYLPARQAVRYSEVAGFPVGQLLPTGGATGQVVKRTAGGGLGWSSSGVSSAWGDVTDKPFEGAAYGAQGADNANKAALYDGDGMLSASSTGSAAGLFIHETSFANTGLATGDGAGLKANGPSASTISSVTGPILKLQSGADPEDKLVVGEDGNLGWTSPDAVTETRANLGLGGLVVAGGNISQVVARASVPNGVVTGVIIYNSASAGVADAQGTALDFCGEPGGASFGRIAVWETSGVPATGKMTIEVANAGGLVTRIIISNTGIAVDGDVEILNAAKGYVYRGSDGHRYRQTVGAGTLDPLVDLGLA